MSSPLHIDFEAVVVHYRDPSAVCDLLESMTTWALPPSRVTIADNSGDLSAFMDGRISSNSPPVKIIDMGANVGYGPAVNEAIKYVDAAVTLVLTQDARLHRDASDVLVRHLINEPGVGATAPLLTYASDQTKVFSSGGKLLKNGRTLHQEQGSRLESLDTSRPPYDVPWADGACFAVRTDIFRALSGFDPSFFLYVEEVDLHLRIRSAGYRVRLVPSALAVQEPGNYTLYFKYRNLTYFTRKHKDLLSAWPWALALPKDLARMAMMGKHGQLPWAIRGLIDSWLGSMGPAPESAWRSRKK